MMGRSDGSRPARAGLHVVLGAEVDLVEGVQVEAGRVEDMDDAQSRIAVRQHCAEVAGEEGRVSHAHGDQHSHPCKQGYRSTRPYMIVVASGASLQKVRTIGEVVHERAADLCVLDLACCFHHGTRHCFHCPLRPLPVPSDDWWVTIGAHAGFIDCKRITIEMSNAHLNPLWQSSTSPRRASRRWSMRGQCTRLTAIVWNIHIMATMLIIWLGTGGE